MDVELALLPPRGVRERGLVSVASAERNRVMAQRIQPTIREVLLTEIKNEDPQGRPMFPSLQQGQILNAVGRQLGASQDQSLEEAILTQWHDLFRTGLLAWGLNLSNPDPPFFHLTQRGRQALASLARDPMALGKSLFADRKSQASLRFTKHRSIDCFGVIATPWPNGMGRALAESNS